MASLTINAMRNFLSRSLSSANLNKVRGVRAEIEFQQYLAALGYGDRVSAGGWIFRSDSRGQFRFGQNTIVVFPETIAADEPYDPDRTLPRPSDGIHTICATFHQSGIRSYFCAAVINEHDQPESVQWRALQLGLPHPGDYMNFPEGIEGFNRRQRPYNFLRYNADLSNIPNEYIPDQFSKESVRIALQNSFYGEISDVDGLFWGRQFTYPVEIKEKTSAQDRSVGDYFGLDIGPFVKLTFYAARRGNLRSLFVVRQIDNETDRNLVAWKFITFERIAEFASWNFRSGGRNMQGGRSATVRIPAEQFEDLNRESLANL